MAASHNGRQKGLRRNSGQRRLRCNSRLSPPPVHLNTPRHPTFACLSKQCFGWASLCPKINGIRSTLVALWHQRSHSLSGTHDRSSPNIQRTHAKGVLGYGFLGRRHCKNPSTKPSYGNDLPSVGCHSLLPFALKQHSIGRLSQLIRSFMPMSDVTTSVWPD